MIVLQTTQATADITRLQAQLSQQAIGQAMARAINRTVLHERTVSIRAAKKKYALPPASFEKYQQFKANWKRLEGWFSASPAGTPIDKVPYTYEPGKGVSFQIMQGKTAVIPYAFRMNANGPMRVNTAIFARGVYAGRGFTRGTARNPIARLQTVSLYQAIAGQVPRVQLNADAKVFYDRTFRNELNYQVMRATGQVR